MNIPGIIIQFKYASAFGMLDDAEAGQVLKELLNGGDGEKLYGMSKMLFSLLSADILQDDRKYSEKVERMKELGKRGGAKSGESRRSNAVKNEACASTNEADEAYASTRSQYNTIQDNTIQDNTIHSLYTRESACAREEENERESDINFSNASEPGKSYDLEEFLNANMKWSENSGGRKA